jgi:tetratricopeptide (TPR) repeat protein
MTDDPFNAEPLSGDASSEGRLAEIFAEYTRRIDVGESIDRDEVLRRHPELAEALLEELESYARIGHELRPDTAVRTLGDYTLRRQLGRGGMGVVYEAWESSMDRRVALKVLPAGIAADDTSFQRFLREARTAGKLSHPSIVPVYATGIREGTPYFAMELIEGETLAALLGRLREAAPGAATPLGPKDDLRFFASLAAACADVAEGLHHAHQRKVVHRDIKPSNLILDRDGRLRILDFGLAHLEGQESITAAGDVVGTPLYMSPEQARRKKVPVDHRTDIYSLGATMYEALTGRPPFRGKDHADTLSQIIERDPVPPKKLNASVPVDLETIVLKCLRKDADDRYATAEALGQDLRRFTRNEAVEARPEGRWERLRRQVVRRRRAWLTALLAAGLLLAAGAAAWMAAERRHERREAAYRDLVVSAVEELPLERLLSLPGTAVLGSELHEDQVLLGTFRVLDRRQLEERARRIEAKLEQAAGLFADRPELGYHLARARSLLAPSGAEGAPADVGIAAALGDHAADWQGGHAALSRGDWKAADAAFTHLTQSLPGSAEPFIGATLEIPISRGIARFEAGDLEGAKRDFTVAGKLWEHAALPAILLARAYLRQGDRTAAAAWLEERFRQLEDRASRDAFAFQSFRLLAQAGARGELLAWAERMEPGRNREVARMQAILWREELGEIHSASEVLEIGQRLVDGGHEDALVHALMAIAASDVIGGQDRRREHLERARGLARGDPHVLLLIADLVPQQEAMELCRGVLAAHPGFAPAQHRLAQAMTFDDPDGAIALLEDLRSRGRDLARVHFDLGLASFTKNLVDEALDHYEKAIALAPGWSGPRIRKAQIHWARRELELVEREYLAMIEAADGKPDRWMLGMLAGLYYEMGRPDDALARYCQAFPRSPGLDSVHMWIFQRLFVEKPGAQRFAPLDDFIPRFETNLTALSDEPWMQQTMALALAHAPTRADLPRALRLAERAVELTGSKDARFLATLAAIRLRAGDAAGAVEALERATIQRLFDRAHVELLGEARKSLLPQVVSVASAEAALDAARPEDLVAASPRVNAESREPLERFLRACALERAGQLDEAESVFRSLLGAPDTGAFTLRHLVGCLRASRRFAEALEALVAALESPGGADREAWELWWQVGHGDLGLDVERLMRELPREAAERTGRSGHRNDMEWLLACIVRNEPLRIDCGAGEDHADPQEPAWSRDRFFVGGWRQTGSHGDKEAGVFNRVTAESGLYAGPILGASYDRPYRDARQYPRRLPDDGYRIPLPAGKYTVRLHFARIRASLLSRRFNVNIDGHAVLTAENPLEGGLGVVELREGEVTIEDSLLDLRIDPGQSLGTISAIEVVRSG